MSCARVRLTMRSLFTTLIMLSSMGASACVVELLNKALPLNRVREVVVAAAEGRLRWKGQAIDPQGIQTLSTWNGYAPVYDNLVGFDSSMRELAERFARILPEGSLLEPVNIADFGAGVGISSAAVLEGAPGRTVYMFDHSSEMLTLAERRLAKIDGARGMHHIRELRLTSDFDQEYPRFFDAAILNNVLYTFPHAENLESSARVKLLRKIWRSLKPGGMLILGDLDPSMQNLQKLIEGEITLGEDAIANGSHVTDTQMAYMMLISMTVLAKENPWMAPAQMEAIAEAAGFEIADRFRGYHDFEHILVLVKPI